MSALNRRLRQILAADLTSSRKASEIQKLIKAREAGAPPAPTGSEWEFAHRDGGAWTDHREDAIRRARFLGTSPVRRRKAGPVEALPAPEEE